MEILQKNHQQGAVRQRPEGIPHLAQQALFGRTNRLALETLQITTRSERGRELQTPSRRICPQHGRAALAPWAGKERGHGIQERQVGFTRAVLLHAPPAR